MRPSILAPACHHQFVVLTLSSCLMARPPPTFRRVAARSGLSSLLGVKAIRPKPAQHGPPVQSEVSVPAPLGSHFRHSTNARDGSLPVPLHGGTIGLSSKPSDKLTYEAVGFPGTIMELSFCHYLENCGLYRGYDLNTREGAWRIVVQSHLRQTTREAQAGFLKAKDLEKYLALGNEQVKVAGPAVRKLIWRVLFGRQQCYRETLPGQGQSLPKQPEFIRAIPGNIIKNLSLTIPDKTNLLISRLNVLHDFTIRERLQKASSKSRFLIRNKSCHFRHCVGLTKMHFGVSRAQYDITCYPTSSKRIFLHLHRFVRG